MRRRRGGVLAGTTTAGRATGCEPSAAEPPAATGTLQGVVWEWQGSQYNDDTEAVPEDPSRYTIEFADDGTATIRPTATR